MNGGGDGLFPLPVPRPLAQTWSTGTKTIEARNDAFRSKLGIVVLPNTEDGPSCGRELCIGISVARNITFQLSAPPFAVGAGPGPMFGTTMPETAIHEDS